MELFNTPVYCLSRIITSICTGEFVLTSIAVPIAVMISQLYRFGTNKKYNVHRHHIVLITGCSSGIGKHMCMYLLQCGYTIYAGVRKQSDADILVSECSRQQPDTVDRLHPIILDVCKADHIDNAYNTLNNRLQSNPQYRLFGLVNNAGVSLQLPIECMTEQQLRQQYEINTIAPILLTNKLLPLLRLHTTQQHTSRILFVSSVAGSIVAPDVAAYASSKHAISAIAHGYRQELRAFNIDVCIISPGSVQSDLRSKGQLHTSNNNTNTMTYPHDHHIEPHILHSYQKSHDKCQQSFDSMSNSACSPIVVSRQIECALRDSIPYTQYLCASEANYIPILTKLPDKIFDRLALMNWTVKP